MEASATGSNREYCANSIKHVWLGRQEEESNIVIEPFFYFQRKVFLFYIDEERDEEWGK